MASRTIIAAALVALAQVAYAQGSDLVRTEANRPVRLELPPTAFAQPGAALSVDLDGYDVSAFSRIDGTTLEIDLEVPLSAGQYMLSVLLFLPDGRVEVVLNAVLDVPLTEGGPWSFSTMLQSSYRTDQQPDLEFQGVDRMTTSGSVALSGRSTTGSWQFASAVDAIYDSYNPAYSSGSGWLMPSYGLSVTHFGNAAETSVGAGNVKVSRDDMLFSRFQRRGAAVESAARSGRFDLTAFSVASTPRNRFDGDYLTPGDSGNQSSGVAASLSVIDEYLRIGGGFVDGKTAYGGSGFNQLHDAAVYGGDSWNLTLDSRSLKGSVWLRIEHASSEFDADGIGMGLPARKDDATQVRLGLSSIGRLASGPFAYWSADLLHKRVGMDFYSIGNLSQPGNVEIASASLQAGFDSVAIDLDVSRQRTNPDDDPWLATQRLRQTGISLSYSPSLLDLGKPLWRSVGAPMLRGWIYRSSESQPAEDAILAGFDVDNSTDETGIGVTFARENLSWGLETGVVEYTDHSEAVLHGGFLIYEPPSDSRNVVTSLQLGWAPGTRVMLDAYLQRNKFEETDFGNEHRSTSYGLSSTVLLMPDKLSLFVSANEGQDRRRFGHMQFLAEELRLRVASMQLNWSIRQPAGGRPGFSVYVKGHYARHEERVFLLREKTWSMFVGADMSWARQ
jgi:hypothetical protein